MFLTGFLVGLGAAALSLGLVNVRAAAAPAAPLLGQPAMGTLLGTADHVSLPIKVTKGYVFLEGEACGRRGVFMFDTGTPFPFMLNNHALPLERTDFVSQGTATSGQKLTLYRHDRVGPITLAGVTLDGLGALNSTDFSFMTDMPKGGIRPDILGLAGLPLVRDYEFVLDYDALTLDLHRLGTSGDPVVPHVQPEEVIATVHFHRTRGEIPVTTLLVGGLEIAGHFDTGSPGLLVLTDEARERLARSGRLKVSGETGTLEGVTCQGVPLTIDAQQLLSGEASSLRLGYNLLRHYRTVWNFRQETIVLLRRR